MKNKITIWTTTALLLLAMLHTPTTALSTPSSRKVALVIAISKFEEEWCASYPQIAEAGELFAKRIKERGYIVVSRIGAVTKEEFKEAFSEVKDLEPVRVVIYIHTHGHVFGLACYEKDTIITPEELVELIKELGEVVDLVWISACFSEPMKKYRYLIIGVMKDVKAIYCGYKGFGIADDHEDDIPNFFYGIDEGWSVEESLKYMSKVNEPKLERIGIEDYYPGDLYL